MNKEKLIKWFDTEMREWAKNKFIADRKTTPIIYKISKLNPNPEEFIVKLKAGLDNSEIESFSCLAGLFGLKEVERYKIIYKGKTFKQIDNSSPSKWIKNFIVETQIPFSILSKFDTNKSITFSKNKNKMAQGGNITFFETLEGKIYFQPRNWGLDGMNKSIEQISNRKSGGDGKLSDKIKLLSEYLGEEVKLLVDGISETWELGKYKQEIFNESNNSNL